MPVDIAEAESYGLSYLTWWVVTYGEFLAGDSQGERMQFNGFNLVLSSSAFFLGNQDSFMSGSEGKIRIS